MRGKLLIRGVNMDRPIIANWIKFKKINNETFMVRNLLDDSEYELDSYYVWFAHQLDGKTDPLSIDKDLTVEDVYDVLKELEAYDIIRSKHFLSLNIFNLLLTLWKPKVSYTLRIISYFANLIIQISFMPLLVMAIWRFLNSPFDINLDLYFVGLMFGTLAGITLHEIAHTVACLGYGGKVFEIGAMLRCFIPGAYVLMNVRNIKNRMHRVQISAAGVEVNIILFSIFLILAVENNVLSGFFYGASICNLLLALVNLTFAEGLDGMTIIGELLGIEDLVEEANNVVKSKAKRNTLINKGMAGKGIVIVCYIIKFLQISMPILVAVNIIEVLLWIL